MKKKVMNLFLALVFLLTSPVSLMAQDEIGNNTPEVVVDSIVEQSQTTQTDSSYIEELKLKYEHEINKLALQTGKEEIIIPIFGIIFGITGPIVLILSVFYFRNRDRKRQYAIVEKAIESGQPIPESLFLEITTKTDSMSRGIKRTFLGIGLFILLWLVTDELSIGSVGLLLMFIGLGEVISAYVKDKKLKDEPKETNNNSPTPTSEVPTIDKREDTEE